MSVEPLEPRTLCAVHQSHDTLTVVGTPGADHIVVSLAFDQGWKYKVEINNATPRLFYLYKFSRLVINGAGGNDLIESKIGPAEAPFAPTVDVKLFGGNGADTLVGGSARDSLYGGAGPDVLIGNDNNDWLDGGAGIDLLSGGAGQDHFDSGSDDIYLDYARSDYDTTDEKPRKLALTGRLVYAGGENGYLAGKSIPHTGFLRLQFPNTTLRNQASPLAGGQANVRGRLVLSAPASPDDLGTPTLIVAAIA